MTRVLYLVEAALVTALAGPVVVGGLWVYRLCTDQPLWLVAVAVPVGFVIRVERHWSPLAWIVGLHGAVNRRIEER